MLPKSGYPRPWEMPDMPDQSRLFPLVLAAISCAGKDTDSSAANWGADDAVDCGGDPVEILPDVSVRCETGDCSLQVISTEPAPPDRGDNTWTVQILDGGGVAMPVSELQASPFMPAHDHGTSPADFVGLSADQVTWTVGPFDLFMPGLWELRVSIQPINSTDSERQVIIPFCVEG